MNNGTEIVTLPSIHGCFKIRKKPNLTLLKYKKLAIFVGDFLMSLKTHIRNAIENENSPINAIVMDTCTISILAESFGDLPIRAVSAIPIPSPSPTYQVAKIPQKRAVKSMG